MTVAGTIVSVAKLRAGTYPSSRHLGAMFELHTGMSVPGWFMAALFLVMAGLMLVLGRWSSGAGDRPAAYTWFGLAAMTTVFSIDEVTSLHVYASNLADVEVFGFYGGYNWVVFGAVFVVVFGVVGARFLWGLPDPFRWRLALGAALFFGGAVGIESLNAWTASSVGDDTLRYILGTSVEEVVEMLGAILVLYALLEHLRTLGIEVRVDFRSSDPDLTADRGA